MRVIFLYRVNPNK